tara:strand:+ start:40 stop:711 length:672 start_codon:yes stop_codon:yes gene_type:complete
MGIRRGSISTPIIADGLVFNMDAANRASYPKTGTTWFDTIGNNNGTLTNGPTFSSDDGGYLVFDGDDEYINLDSTITNNIYTLDFWYKMAGNDGTYGYFASSGVNGLAISEGGTIFGLSYGQFYYYNGSANLLSNIPSTTNWNHICVIINTISNNLKLYGNSIELTDTTVTSMSTSITDIGRYVASFHNLLYGNLASYRIYNRALSSIEVLHNYNALKGRFGL